MGSSPRLFPGCGFSCFVSWTTEFACPLPVLLIFGLSCETVSSVLAAHCDLLRCSCVSPPFSYHSSLLPPRSPYMSSPPAVPFRLRMQRTSSIRLWHIKNLLFSRELWAVCFLGSVSLSLTTFLNEEMTTMKRTVLRTKQQSVKVPISPHKGVHEKLTGLLCMPEEGQRASIGSSWLLLAAKLRQHLRRVSINQPFLLQITVTSEKIDYIKTKLFGTLFKTALVKQNLFKV